MHGDRRYMAHRFLPMRLIDKVQRWLLRRYRRTHSEWSKRWLDRVAWFTTPYGGARQNSSLVDALDWLLEDEVYGLYRFNTTNVRWEGLRTRGDKRYRALGLTGGTHGR